MKYIIAVVLCYGFFSCLSSEGASEKNRFKKMVMIVLENTSYEEAIRQPDLYRLSRQGALLTNFSAKTHPSQGNYIHMIAGDSCGVKGNGTVNLKQSHIGDLLEKAGLDWHVYAEDYPGNCFLKGSKKKYVRKHNPFLSFLNVSTNPKRCAKVTNEESFERDFNAGNLPAFTMYIPNLNNDGHDTGVDFAGKFIAKKFGPLFSNQEAMKNTLFVLTFDENDGARGNRIYTVLLGAGIQAASTSDQSLGHESVLKLLEEEFSLGSLNRSDSSAESILGIWK